MSLPVCKFYSSNKTCRFGKNCRYSHSSDRPPSLSKDTVQHHEEHIKDQISASYLEETQVNPTPLLAPSTDENEVLKSKASVGDFFDNNLLSKSEETENGSSKVKHFFNNYSSRPVCHYYFTYGNCRNGRFCRFSHQISNWNSRNYQNESYKSKRTETNVPPRFRKVEKLEADQGPPEQNDEHLDDVISHITHSEANINEKVYPVKKETQKRICPFYKSARCWRGEKCKFLHEKTLSSYENVPRKNKALAEKKNQEELPNNREGIDDKNIKVPQLRPIGFRQIFTYKELEDIGLTRVRDIDILAMKKRFPKEKVTIVEDGDKFSLRLCFTPTDPDWPFDVNKFDLLFKIPVDYPKKMMSVTLPVDQDLPETVRRYVEVSIKEWLDHKIQQLAIAGKVELVFRPFLRWLDRNIEEIVTEALQQLKRELIAKAAGLEFIPAARLKARFQTQSESSENDDRNDEVSSSNEDDEKNNSSEEEETSETGSDSGEDIPRQMDQCLNLDPEKKGTEISLLHLQLRENASALMFENLRLILQCQRCKHHSELTVQPNRVMSIACGKCNQKQFVNYRPSLIHQFTSVVGYLDVDGCQAFDLIFQECRVVVTCLGCSKQTRVDGIASGQMIDGWCQACNAKFKLATEAVKFSQLVPSGINTGGKVVEVSTARAKKLPKDPAIKEGFPLPEFGTCKHYKHSYRWLRFPCCGKAYPCDVCHDKKEDHEMIMATRMICGHCCKEQNYSGSRPCNSCGQHMTKIRSAHWEGGKGCRDKISMSKNDQQKYKNMNKTQSNHKKKVETGSTKKNTKLRHV